MRVFKSEKPSFVSLDKNTFSNPSSCCSEVLSSVELKKGFVFSKRLIYESSSDWVANTEPSSAVKEFLLILLNKNSERNNIAINMKTAIAIKVISMNLVIIMIYLS